MACAWRLPWQHIVWTCNTNRHPCTARTTGAQHATTAAQPLLREQARRQQLAPVVRTPASCCPVQCRILRGLRGVPAVVGAFWSHTNTAGGSLAACSCAGRVRCSRQTDQAGGLPQTHTHTHRGHAEVSLRHVLAQLPCSGAHQREAGRRHSSCLAPDALVLAVAGALAADWLAGIGCQRQRCCLARLHARSARHGRRQAHCCDNHQHCDGPHCGRVVVAASESGRLGATAAVVARSGRSGVVRRVKRGLHGLEYGY
jgi:hypothetical protein